MVILTRQDGTGDQDQEPLSREVPRADAAQGGRPHVVMLVANAVTVDNRVRRMAATASLGGYQVTVIGLALNGAPPGEDTIGDVRIIRVPIKYPLHRANQEKARRTRELVAPSPENFASSAAELADQRAWAKIDLGEAAADVGSARVAYREARRARTTQNGIGSWLRSHQAHIRLRRAEAALDDAKRALERMSSPSQTRPQSPWPSQNVPPPRDPLMPTRVRSRKDAAQVRHRWRALIPRIEDLDLAMRPVLSKLDADIVHAHDVHTMAVASRFIRTARGKGNSVACIYDAHEFVAGLPRYADDVLQAMVDFESAHIAHFDSVITVSDSLANALRDQYRLCRRPTVVRNIPHTAPRSSQATTVRSVLGLDAETPLLVYAGGVNGARGVEDLIGASALRPEVHVAIVLARTNTGAQKVLTAEAARLGVSQRTHFLPFVSGERVVDYLSSASAGVSTIRTGWANHDFALTNKLFEYLRAGLPLILSDCLEQSLFISRHPDVGVVYRSGSAESLANAIDEILARAPAAKEAARRLASQEYRWVTDAQTLIAEYERVTDHGAGGGLPDDFESRLARTLMADSRDSDGLVKIGRSADPGAGETPQDQRGPAASHQLRIGPANMAGQGYAWAEALNRAHQEHATGDIARSFAIGRGPFAFPSHDTVPAGLWASSTAHQAEALASVLSQASHVLNEGGWPLFHHLIGDHFSTETDLLDRHGISHGVVFHGSDIRVPDVHMAREPWSQYWDMDPTLVRRLGEQARRNRSWVESYGGRVFVSTPGQLEFLDGAIWLPLVVSVPDDIRPISPASSSPIHTGGHAVLRVGFFPSRRSTKGASHVEAACERLQSEGLIEFRMPRGPIPFNETWRFIAGVDVVVDGLVSGNYGVTSCQAMALGRVAICHVSDFARAVIGEHCPVVEANPATLEGVLRRLAGDRAEVVEVALSGLSYASRRHSGSESAAVLSPWLATTGG